MTKSWANAVWDFCGDGRRTGRGDAADSRDIRASAYGRSGARRRPIRDLTATIAFPAFRRLGSLVKQPPIGYTPTASSSITRKKERLAAGRSAGRGPTRDVLTATGEHRAAPVEAAGRPGIIAGRKGNGRGVWITKARSGRSAFDGSARNTKGAVRRGPSRFRLRGPSWLRAPNTLARRGAHHKEAT
jgi:hypothetical protein